MRICSMHSLLTGRIAVGLAFRESLSNHRLTGYAGLLYGALKTAPDGNALSAGPAIQERQRSGDRRLSVSMLLMPALMVAMTSGSDVAVVIIATPIHNRPNPASSAI